jgi:hypothetical protein
MNIAPRRVRRASVVAVAAWSALCAASAALAAQPGDYAWRWPLKTEGQSAAWQFELTPEIYNALVDPELRDFEVFNADGQSVPVARLTVDPEAVPGVAEVSLPVFALPRGGGADAGAAGAVGDDLRLRLERDGTGRLHLLQLESTAGAPVALIDHVMDADLNRDPQRPATVDRLELHWRERGDVRTRFAVEGSDDLEHWQTLVEAATVVSLRRDGAMLQRRDIALPATGLRYLRLRQLDGDPLPDLQVSARRTRAGAVVPQWRRLAAEFVAADPDEFAKGQVYRYKLPATLPVSRLGIALGTDNATTEVIVDARTAGSQAWVPIGRTLLFRLRQGTIRVDNDDYALTSPFAAREWRVRSPVALDPAPRMEVVYLPERFVFLAQGPGPYTLAAGSRDARREPRPVEQALAPLRARLGADWTPPPAGFGARAESAGEQAYTGLPKPIDWRRWMLWGFLILGTAVVGGFALTLLRTRSTAARG